MKINNIIYTLIFLVLCVFLSACEKQDHNNGNTTDARIENLLKDMTLEEKLGQMNQLGFWGMSEDLENQIAEGKVGSILNIVNPVEINKLQEIAMSKSRLKIPLLIGRDVVHGFKTIFPIPLGQAASFDAQMVKEGAAIAGIEARESGINWTFAPMLDVSRDARWGRIAESLGEDTYLTTELGVAMIQGFQGDTLSRKSPLVACAKHFAGYGAVEGGRDYNSTYISLRQMHNTYLPPFQKAVEAGVGTIMTSFNDNDGIPATASEYLLQDILRKQWGFDGFVVSDWESVREMIAHGYAKDDKDAAILSLNAGVDMEMVSGTFLKYAPELLKEGKISIEDINNSVRDILRIKFELGLFENSYTDTGKTVSAYSKLHLEAAKQAAIKSAVLLKNDNSLLPLKTSSKIAIFGPMANAPHDQLGTWVFDGEKEHTVTPLLALKDYPEVKYIYEPVLAFSRDKDKSKFEKAKQVAKQADVSILFLGEESILSGEAHSLSNINLIGVQSELLQAIKSTGKPVVVVIMAGRPLTIERDLPFADAVLFNFHPGTMGGPAIWDLLFGNANPSGRLPVTFVREVGQIPMYYNHTNTGRPSGDDIMTLERIPLEAGQTSLGNTSFYLDSGKDPLFPFGYGLSYSKFVYDDVKTSKEVYHKDEKIKASVMLSNVSNVTGTEVVQLYIRDLTGSITRPVKELKGFERVTLEGGKSRKVEFEISPAELAFFGRNNTKELETGEYHLWIGSDSDSGSRVEFSIQ